MSQNQLFDEFEELSKDDWLLKAEKDLKGKSLDDLSSNWYGIKIEPYYSIEDINSLDTPPIESGVKRWTNYVEILADDETKANKLAKEHLSLGATGVLFDLKRSPDFTILLDGIHLDHCSISFKGETNLNSYLDYLADHHPEAKVSGFIDRQIVESNPSSDDFYATIIRGESTNEITELTELLSMCYELLAEVDNDDAETAIKNMAYEVALSTNYFFGIAKIRALRLLLIRFYQAYQLTYFSDSFHIIGSSKAWVKSDYEPHENMLKATTSAMAAISGGCNSLIIAPGYEDEQEELVSRNISTVLEFESYLGKIADPAAGSYFIEHLTDEIVNTVWAEFKINK
jgi:methylmalonyl-CoA mutase